MISRICPHRRERINQEIEYENSLVLLYQMINMSYSIDLNTPYRLFRLYESIRCLSRRVDTSYPTGGYGVSVDLSEHDT
ncbi:hypothetical protein Tco_0830581 [Tanacetum coccineum]